jgi:hypothetical protein
MDNKDVDGNEILAYFSIWKMKALFLPTVLNRQEFESYVTQNFLHEKLHLSSC